WTFARPGVYYVTLTVRPSSGTEITATPLQPSDANPNAAQVTVLPTLSGVVSDAAGVGLPGVEIRPNSGTSVFTDEGGNYILPVPLGWSGTVTPIAAGHSFQPASYSYENIAESIADQNFTADAYSSTGQVALSGTVRADQNPLAGVRIDLTGQPGAAST